MDPLFEAVAAPRRRAILRLLWDGEQSAGEIHRALGDVTFGAVSQHLRVLAVAGVVDRRVVGKKRLYRARKRELGPLRAWLEQMWSDALYELKWRAELEEARRGPRARKTRKSRRRSWAVASSSTGRSSSARSARRCSVISPTAGASPHGGAPGRR